MRAAPIVSPRLTGGRTSDVDMGKGHSSADRINKTYNAPPTLTCLIFDGEPQKWKGTEAFSGCIMH